MHSVFRPLVSRRLSARPVHSPPSLTSIAPRSMRLSAALSLVAPTLSVLSSLNSNISQTMGFSTSSSNASSTKKVSDAASAVEDGGSSLASLKLVNSWPRTLSPETSDNKIKSIKVEGLPEDTDNRSKRPVFNGHFVLVKPTGIAEPELILLSTDVAENLLHLTPAQVAGDEFLQWVSGNTNLAESWATPYALSIMGTRYTNNCPYGTGNGYGDGRAISIGEFEGHELQLKGGGTTPFHRGADGRAVLRSSIREFLASEAMHYLGVKTTRALSLVVSGKDTVARPWYTPDAILSFPDMDDPRLAQYSLEQRKNIVKQLRSTQKADPNIMIQEKCAITCRVASSFTRIGHIDLFARRAERKSMETANDTDARFNTETNEWKELTEIIWHACQREFPKEAYDPFIESKDLAGAADKLLELSAENIATMVSKWLSVGFAQGNFNADNCLVGGKTMDYGPFGFMEEYSPLFAKWTGSGQHFGFLNQPSAGLVNYQVLVESVAPVICASKDVKSDPEPVIESFMEKAQATFETKLKAIFREKLGFQADSDAADELWSSLKELMGESRVDWTLFWRQLSYVMRDFTDLSSGDYEGMFEALQGKREEANPFYEEIPEDVQKKWISWIQEWRELHRSSQLSNVAETMLQRNPKYVLREWMLVDAYTTADEGDYSVLKDMYELIQRPYEEGSSKEEELYFRRAPERALATGGTAFMS